MFRDWDNYFGEPPRAHRSNELVPEGLPSIPDPLPALADAEMQHMPGLLGQGPPAKLDALLVPQLSWVSSDVAVTHTANYTDATKMSTILTSPTSVGQAWTWQVASAASGRRHSVRIPHAVPTGKLTSPLRHVIFCSCPGHKILKELHPERPDDRICKHAAYVLLEVIRLRRIDKSAENKVAVGIPTHLAIVDGASDQQKKKRPQDVKPGPPLQVSPTGEILHPGATAEVVGPTGEQLNIAWSGPELLPAAMLNDKGLELQGEIQRERTSSGTYVWKSPSLPDGEPREEEQCSRPRDKCGIHQCEKGLPEHAVHDCFDCDRPTPWRPIRPAATAGAHCARRLQHRSWEFSQHHSWGRAPIVARRHPDAQDVQLPYPESASRVAHPDDSIHVQAVRSL